MRRSKWSIPETYNGIQFRSKLEADWARFFDRHRIKYAYESEGFDLNGLWYLPDFYLPEIKTFVEVKGALDDKDETKMFALARVAAPKGIMVILAEAPAGEQYRLIRPSPQDFEHFPIASDTYLCEDVALALCAQCSKWFFMETWATWRCSACGFYDGNCTYKTVHRNNPAGWGGDRCLDCGK